MLRKVRNAVHNFFGQKIWPARFHYKQRVDPTPNTQETVFHDTLQKQREQPLRNPKKQEPKKEKPKAPLEEYQGKNLDKKA